MKARRRLRHSRNNQLRTQQNQLIKWNIPSPIQVKEYSYYYSQDHHLCDTNIVTVVRQNYEVQVYDEYVISGNTVVLKCQVPSSVAEYIMVTSWTQDGIVNIYPNTDTGELITIVFELEVKPFKLYDFKQ